MKRTVFVATAAPLAVGYATGAASPTTKRVEPQVAVGAVIDGFTPPEPQRSGGATPKYPFDDLMVGGYFGVKNKTKRDMAGPVTRANIKYSTRAKDPSTGKTKVLSTDREFYAVDVDAATTKTLKGTAFEGSTVLVVRRK
jgi:hypothetical protein